MDGLDKVLEIVGSVLLLRIYGFDESESVDEFSELGYKLGVINIGKSFFYF